MYFIELILLALGSAALSFFYRNCLREKEMIFNPIKNHILKPMWHKGGVLKWLSKPLGLCVYCNTTWVNILLYFMSADISLRCWAVPELFEILYSIGFSHVFIKIIMYYYGRAKRTLGSGY